MNRSNRHHAEVIEIYENGAKAAVRFTSGRIECVSRKPGEHFHIGQRGMVDYVPTENGYIWTFKEFKGKLSNYWQTRKATNINLEA